MIQSFLQLYKSKRGYLFLGLFACIGGFLCIRNGHEWGDDFALYLSQANALLKGNTAELAKYNTWSMQHSDGTLGPFLYPPGYPLFLTLYLKFFPFNWVGIKIFQWIFYLIGAFAFYSLVQSFRVKLPQNWGIYLLAIVMIHPKIIEFADRIMSDLWFLVTVYLFFYFLFSSVFSKSTRLWLTGISLILASITRVNGFLLVASWWIFIVSENKINWRLKLKELLMTLPFVMVVFYFKKIDSQFEANHLNLLNSINFSSVYNNLFLYYKQIGQYALWHLGFLPLTGVIFGFVLLFYFGFALRKIERLKLFAPILIWIFINFALIVVWPIAQGTRYLLPIIPFIFWIAIVGFNDWIENQRFNKWITLVFVCFIFIQSAASVTFYRFFYNTNKVIGTTQTDIYEKIKLIVNDNDVIAFEKPRWLHLATNKKCIRTQSDSSFFVSPANYWLITNKNIYSGRVKKLTDQRLDSIYGNSDFTLYRRNGSK